MADVNVSIAEDMIVRRFVVVTNRFHAITPINLHTFVIHAGTENYASDQEAGQS